MRMITDSSSDPYSSPYSAQPYSSRQTYGPRQTYASGPNNQQSSTFPSSGTFPSSSYASPPYHQGHQGGQREYKPYPSPACSTHSTYEDHTPASGGSSSNGSGDRFGGGTYSRPHEVKNELDAIQDEYGSDGDSSWMNNVDLEDIVKKETSFGSSHGAPKTERSEDEYAKGKQLIDSRFLQLITVAYNATQIKCENRPMVETPEAIKRRQLEHAKLEERRKRDVVEPPPVVNGVSLRRKSDLGCKSS